MPTHDNNEPGAGITPGAVTETPKCGACKEELDDKVKSVKCNGACNGQAHQAHWFCVVDTINVCFGCLQMQVPSHLAEQCIYEKGKPPLKGQLLFFRVMNEVKILECTGALEGLTGDNLHMLAAFKKRRETLYASLVWLNMFWPCLLAKGDSFWQSQEDAVSWEVWGWLLFSLIHCHDTEDKVRGFAELYVHVPEAEKENEIEHQVKLFMAAKAGAWLLNKGGRNWSATVESSGSSKPSSTGTSSATPNNTTKNVVEAKQEAEEEEYGKGIVEVKQEAEEGDGVAEVKQEAEEGDGVAEVKQESSTGGEAEEQESHTVDEEPASKRAKHSSMP